MEKIFKSKRTFLILTTCFVFLTNPSKVLADNENIVEYNIEYKTDNGEPFASYNGFNIYIGDIEYIETIKQEDTGDIYIIDDRKDADPDMSICDSYGITSRSDMNVILEVLLEYEREYPSDWDRTKSSMLNEWIIHNMLYRLKYERQRTDQVDLNNADEAKYDLNILKK